MKKRTIEKFLKKTELLLILVIIFCEIFKWILLGSSNSCYELKSVFAFWSYLSLGQIFASILYFISSIAKGLKQAFGSLFLVAIVIIWSFMSGFAFMCG